MTLLAPTTLLLRFHRDGLTQGGLSRWACRRLNLAWRLNRARRPCFVFTYPSTRVQVQVSKRDFYMSSPFFYSNLGVLIMLCVLLLGNTIISRLDYSRYTLYYIDWCLAEITPKRPPIMYSPTPPSNKKETSKGSSVTLISPILLF